VYTKLFKKFYAKLFVHLPEELQSILKLLASKCSVTLQANVQKVRVTYFLAKNAELFDQKVRVSANFEFFEKIYLFLKNFVRAQNFG